MNLPRLLLSQALLALALGHGTVHADVTTEWVSIASNSTLQAAAPTLRMVREAASTAAAAAKRRPDSVTESADAAERHDAAVAVAAFVVLERLFPEQREGLEWQLAVSFSRIPESAAKAEGAAIGRKVALEMLAARELAAAGR